MSFYHRLAARRERREETAIVDGDEAVSWGELSDRVARRAGALRGAGARPGDVVAVQTAGKRQFVEWFLGALHAGTPFVPINDRATATEAAYLLSDSGARVAVLDRADIAPSGCTALAPSASAPPIDPTPADPVAICYTSGTTGQPKGARLTSTNLTATVEGLHQAWRWSPDDRLLHALPLFHIHGLIVALLGGLWARATVELAPRFDALDTLRALERSQATVFMGVPTFYQRFVELPAALTFDLSHMRLFTCGSAPLPAHVFDAFARRFGHRVLERYGMTEVGIVLSNPYEGERRSASVGVPLPGVIAEIADATTDRPVPDGEPGELRIGGPSVFAGYHGAPEKTAAALDASGRVRTGDLAIRSPDGYFRIVGRLRDLVIAGGLNVYPSEIEAVIIAHSAVLDVATVGVIDADLGERLVADVVLRDAAELDAVIAHVATALAPYKRPRAWQVVPALMRNAMGKVEKAAIRARWERPIVRAGRADDTSMIARGNLALAQESEGKTLDIEVATEGARAVFDRNVGARYFVAEVAGDYAGQCMVTMEWSDWRARPVWWLQSVWVHPAYRRRGVFRALYDTVIASGHAAGAAGVRLYVDRTNTSAMDVYRSLGMDGEHYAVFEAMFTTEAR